MRTLIVNQYLKKSSIVTDGLVLHLDAGNLASYPGTGTTWIDLKNGNNGTLLNGVGFDSNNGGSLTFDGIDDYVEVSNSINPINSLSIDCWVYISSAVQNPNAVDKWDWPQNKRSFFLGTEREIISTSVSFDGSFTNRLVCLGSSVNAVNNTWINLTMSYDNQTLRLYENASLISSSAYSVPRDIYDDSATKVWLMRTRGSDEGRHISGNLAKVFVYNKALSQEEIQQNHDTFKDLFI